MTPTTLFVCSICRFSAQEGSRDGVAGGQYLINQLQQALAEQNLQATVHLEPLRCMAGCHQPCNVSVAAPGKLTFILSGVSPENGAAMVAEFCQQYTESTNGRVPYSDRTPKFVGPPPLSSPHYLHPSPATQNAQWGTPTGQRFPSFGSSGFLIVVSTHRPIHPPTL